MTQAEFAEAFHLPITTLRDWEQHRSTPDAPARALLLAIERDPEVMRRLLADRAGLASAASSRCGAPPIIKPRRSGRAHLHRPWRALPELSFLAACHSDPEPPATIFSFSF